MNKEFIKSKLSNLIFEEKPKGLVATEKTQKEEDNINKDYYKEVDKKMGEYDKSSKKEDKNAIKPVKYNYSKSDKDIHDEFEIRNGLEMTRYDNESDEKFKERAESAIVGDSKMGNKDNSEPSFNGSTKDFAKNLVKTIKKSAKKRNDSITPTVQFGDDVEVLPKETKKVANKRKVAVEGIKRLNYRKEFNGLENAINLIPERYKVDKKVFEMADINETYRIRWEGDINEGQAIVLRAENKKIVSESMNKIKHLMGFKSNDQSGRLNSSERLAEDVNFTKVWDKAKSIIKETENNPWAICTSSVGREDKEKFESCVRNIKKEKNISENEDEEIYNAKQKEIKDWSKAKNSTDHQAARELTIANNKNRPKSVQGY